jgi:hypothetical protein
LEGVYHLQRTRFELIAERKLRRRQLTYDANVEITGRDLREREAAGRSTHASLASADAAISISATGRRNADQGGRLALHGQNPA